MFDGFKDEDEGRSPGQRLIYKNNATRGHNFLIQFNPQLILQTVEITSPTELTICEIKFKESGKITLHVYTTLASLQQSFCGRFIAGSAFKRTRRL